MMPGRGRAVVRLVVAMSSLVLSRAARGADAYPLVEYAPVPGGIAAIAAAVDAHASPEPARAAAELPRMIYEWVEGSAPAERRVRAVLAALRLTQPADTAELMAIPLGRQFWSDVVFRRPVASADLVETILIDRNAALLCRGLAGVDDATLAFIASRPALVRSLYENDAAAFAAFADSLRIERDRVDVPGGDLARPLWTAVLGVDPADAEAFTRELFSRGAGRIAYLYDTIAHLDDPHRLFALGAAMPDSARAERFKALASIAIASCPEWDVRQRPFGRPPHEIGVLLRDLRVTPEGRLAPPASREFWAHAFGHGTGDASADADAAWLADEIVTSETIRRAERLDQLAFAQRVFGGADGREVLDVVGAYPRFPMLMLALERMHVRTPSTYAELLKAARHATSQSMSRAVVALSQFQGALALLVRAVDVHTLEPVRAEALAVQLAHVPLTDGEYLGGVARWITSALLPAAGAAAGSTSDGAGSDIDDAVEAIVAGAAPPEPAVIPWEDRVYTLDLAAPERQRLRRIRATLGTVSLDDAIRGVADQGAADRRRARQSDQQLAAALRALVYAMYLGDPDGTALLGGDLSARHDFGFGSRDNPEVRPWSEPREQIAPHVARFVSGSLLNLDLALAPLALTRIDPADIVAPTLNPNDRDSFAQSVALMNPYELRDRDLETIALATAAGRSRVGRAAPADLDAIADEIHMDGWRRRSLRLTMAAGGDPLSHFSSVELLVLGNPSAAASLAAWGTTGRPVDGCVCTRLPGAGAWQLFIGRPQFGLLATQVADLQIAVAIALHERHLPAALARGVLAAAMQRYTDAARPADNGDWLGLVRAARTIDPDRIDDYIAMLAAGGPLVPVPATKPHGEYR